jgi:lysozyme family protein
MKHNFDKAFKLVVGHEGGLSLDPRDRGNWTTGVINKGTLRGTKYGVSAMTYPNVDIQNLTIEQAKEIYYRDFWGKIKGDLLPSGLDYLLFDIAINHGTRDAGVFIQRAVGATPDGAIGPQTLGRINARSTREMIISVNVERAFDYGNIGTFITYGRGWSRRNIESTLTALEMISASEPPLDPSKADVSQDDTILGGLFRRVNQ